MISIKDSKSRCLRRCRDVLSKLDFVQNCRAKVPQSTSTVLLRVFVMYLGLHALLTVRGFLQKKSNGSTKKNYIYIALFKISHFSKAFMHIPYPSLSKEADFKFTTNRNFYEAKENTENIMSEIRTIQ